MKFPNLNRVVVALLALSLAANGYFVWTNYSLEKNAFCASFKDDAANKIRTYYASPGEENIYPNEIFYSTKANTCVALWSTIETNPAMNGFTEHKIIFNPVTNEKYVSVTLFHVTNQTEEEELETVRGNLLYEEAYRTTLERFR